MQRLLLQKCQSVGEFPQTGILTFRLRHSFGSGIARMIQGYIQSRRTYLLGANGILHLFYSEMHREIRSIGFWIAAYGDGTSPKPYEAKMNGTPAF